MIKNAKDTWQACNPLLTRSDLHVAAFVWIRAPSDKGREALKDFISYYKLDSEFFETLNRNVYRLKHNFYKERSSLFVSTNKFHQEKLDNWLGFMYGIWVSSLKFYKEKPAIDKFLEFLTVPKEEKERVVKVLQKPDIKEVLSDFSGLIKTYEKVLV